MLSVEKIVWQNGNVYIWYSESLWLDISLLWRVKHLPSSQPSEWMFDSDGTSFVPHHSPLSSPANILNKTFLAWWTVVSFTFPECPSLAKYLIWIFPLEFLTNHLIHNRAALTILREERKFLIISWKILIRKPDCLTVWCIARWYSPVISPARVQSSHLTNSALIWENS